MLRRWKAGFVMGNYYRQEDISSALSELMESPYANSEPFLYLLGVKDCLKLVKDMVDGKVSDSLKIHVADVRENVRGEWKINTGLYCCSNCRNTAPYDVEADIITYWPNLNFCPNCGAKMSGAYDDTAV